MAAEVIAAAGLSVQEGAPEDPVARSSELELGVWSEEAAVGNRCAGSLDGAQRDDGPNAPRYGAYQPPPPGPYAHPAYHTYPNGVPIMGAAGMQPPYMMKGY